MLLKNDDFKRIVEIFEEIIIEELNVIKAEAEYLDDNATLEEINAILKADCLITHISNQIDNDCFFKEFLDYEDNDETRNCQKHQKYFQEVISCVDYIVTLFNEFNIFEEALNKNENDKITVREAILCTECMNAIIEFSRREKNDEYGISLMNAAEAYQYIANDNIISPKEIKELRDTTKAKWKHYLTSFKLKSIGKGKYGAMVYSLREMANFVYKIEGRIRTGVLLKEFKKHKEHPLPPP